VWVAHVGADRLVGYGLKYLTEFGDTHLGRLADSGSLSADPGVADPAAGLERSPDPQPTPDPASDR
jgi:hypothetical protein